MTREDAFEIWLPIIKMGVKSMPECSEALDMAITALKQEPCTDAISREELLRAIDTWDKFGYTETGCFVREPKGDYVPYIHYDDVINCIKSMPPVTPQYTDAEIQRMQELEQAEIQKAYEIGKAENIEVLDKIRAEFISLYPKNYAGELELGGASCVFSLYKVLSIIDKYKASPTGAEEENE